MSTCYLEDSVCTSVSIVIFMFLCHWGCSMQTQKSPSRTGYQPRLGLSHTSWVHARISTNALGPFKLWSFSLVPLWLTHSQHPKSMVRSTPTKEGKLNCWLRKFLGEWWEQRVLHHSLSWSSESRSFSKCTSLLWGCISQRLLLFATALPAVTTGRWFGILHVMFCIHSLNV